MSSGLNKKKCLVFVDADNTLWDTDGVFAQAQLNLLSSVEATRGRTLADKDRLQVVRIVDQSIAERHHLGLRYPARLLVFALSRVLDGVDPAAVARTVWPAKIQGSEIEIRSAIEIEKAFYSDIRTVPALLPGVADGLRQFQKASIDCVVLTEGPRAGTIDAMRVLGLENYASRVIEAPKSEKLFQRLVRVSEGPRKSFMIGDQLQRDIAPAKAAGFITIYVPSRFRPKWEPEHEQVVPHYVVEDFRQAVETILTICRPDKVSA